MRYATKKQSFSDHIIPSVVFEVKTYEFSPFPVTAHTLFLPSKLDLCESENAR
jgi:hypothetical protein